MKLKDISVLQISCEGLGNGGVQKIIMDLKRNICCKKNDIVLFTNEKRYYDAEFEKLCGKIYRIPIEKHSKIMKPLFKVINIFKVYLNICTILNNTHYDVIHCHNEFEAGICLMAAKKHDISIRISHHHRSDYNDFSKSSIFVKIYNNILKKMILKYSTKIICCSNDTKKALFGEQKKEKLEIIYNSINIKQYTSVEKKSHKDIILTNIGQYCYNKNQQFLIEIAKKLKKLNFNFKMYLIGFGNYRDELIKKINQNNLQNVYLIDGLLEEKINFLKETDIFLFPSIKEGFGIALLEAQAMNINCFASDTITRESNVGLVEYLDINNIDLWVKKIISYNKNINYSHNFELLKRFDIEYFIENIEKIYEGRI